MKTKVCKKCKIEKEITEFYKHEAIKKDGLKVTCKVCYRNARKIYRENNKEKIAEYRKKHYKQNKEQISEKSKERYIRDKGKRQLYYQNNKDKLKKQSKDYYSKNRERAIKNSIKYERERKNNDPVYKMIRNYRKRTWDAYKNNTKSKSTMDLLGCSGQELAQHLEKQFQDGMTHDNYGEWHIDHIRPIASFDLSDPKQEEECFHYTNLQPLWAWENMSKGAKYEQ